MLTLVSETDARQIVTLAEAKDHLRITLDAEDSRTMQKVDAAISWTSDYTRRPVRRGQYRFSLGNWQVIDGRYGIRLYGFISTVDSIQYADSDGDLQTISSTVYDVLIGQHSTLIREARNQSWPALSEHLENIRVTFTAGWTGDDVPYQIREAALLKLQYLVDNDEPADQAAKMLLDSWRLPPW